MVLTYVSKVVYICVILTELSKARRFIVQEGFHSRRCFPALDSVFVFLLRFLIGPLGYIRLLGLVNCELLWLTHSYLRRPITPNRRKEMSQSEAEEETCFPS